MKTVLGIDPSLTGSAISVFRDGDFRGCACFTSKPATGWRARMQRFANLADAIVECMRLHNPDVICLEGYSMGSRGNITSLCEFGGILRMRLMTYVKPECQLFEVAPTTLKKFVLGKGNGEKELMMQQVLKRWGFEASNNDEADAYGLSRMAMCIAGVCEPENEAQREAVHTVLHGKSKPAKKRKATTNDT